MKSSVSFHNSGVCEQLQASIIRFFEENYAATCDVEIDAIICLSLLDTSDQNVIKIHKVLPKHLFKFGDTTASLPQKTVSQDGMSKRFHTLKIPTLRPAVRRRKPLKVNIARQIQKPFIKDKCLFNAHNLNVGGNHVHRKIGIPSLTINSDKNRAEEHRNRHLLNSNEQEIGLLQGQGYIDNSTDLSEQQYLLDDTDLQDNATIKAEPFDSDYECVKEKNLNIKRNHVNEKCLDDNEFLISCNSEKENINNETGSDVILSPGNTRHVHEQMRMYITDEGTVIKAENDCEENLTVESLVMTKNEKLKPNYSDSERKSTIGENEDDLFEVREQEFGSCSEKYEEFYSEPRNNERKKKIFEENSSLKPMDYIVLQRNEKLKINSLQDSSNGDQLNHINNSVTQMEQYSAYNSGTQYYHSQNSTVRPYAKSLFTPELFKRKQRRPRKLTPFKSENSPNQIEPDCSDRSYNYDNTNMYKGDDKLFTSSFMKVLESTPERLKLRLDNHSGSPVEKKFFCEQCGTGFSSKKSKLRHERHTCGSRSFPCSICAKTFSRADSKQRHIWKVHGIKVISHSQVNSYNYVSNDLGGQHLQGEDMNVASDMQQDYDRSIDQNGYTDNSFCVTDTSFQDNPADTEDTDLDNNKCLVDFSHRDGMELCTGNTNLQTEAEDPPS